MRIGVDVGGTNTDAVLIDGLRIVATNKQPTTPDVSSGVSAAIRAVLGDANVAPAAITAVMIGTTHFTNALVEANRLDRVAIMRLASPSGEALPPFTGWPENLAQQISSETFLLPGGYEFDGREISAFDEGRVRAAARRCREGGINNIAVSSAFAPINAAMEERAAQVVHAEHPAASISLSHTVGRLGLIERENGVILNAALISLARHVVASLERALGDLKLAAPLFISQNDGTLISAEDAARYPVMTIGSGPTNSMRGAAFLTGINDAIVMDVGGTTCDIGVLSKGFPRESSISVDIGGVRTNFRMPDILAMGLGGGTRIHLDPARYMADALVESDLRIGPDSVGYRILQDAFLFGGQTLTASDVAVAAGRTRFGDASSIPPLSATVQTAVWHRMQAMFAEGVDRMKTAQGDVPIIAVGGGHFLIDNDLPGATQVLRPPHAAVANAVGAAIAQIGAQLEQIVDYDSVPRHAALERMREAVMARVTANGGQTDSIRIVDMEEVFLSYLPGRSAQVRMKAVGDLAEPTAPSMGTAVAGVRHAH
ncbi:hydantoinase/oxoprolinase N-terminal domain-containing protein [Sphingosinicella soli]|uniref:N-methylhydantoinase A/oxoprolinase/acetone carboxylase beta subunit n=1 Tax=Sphingosinicella soli TaxID=333708 RepID=A0A7W7AYT0_9SPHN|nr:N-methylhydantoinase A/oxoprolinase/acetone carboxylase beta subunit [Sphingosinicella soli]